MFLDGLCYVACVLAVGLCIRFDVGGFGFDVCVCGFGISVGLRI